MGVVGQPTQPPLLLADLRRRSHVVGFYLTPQPGYVRPKVAPLSLTTVQDLHLTLTLTSPSPSPLFSGGILQDVDVNLQGILGSWHGAWLQRWWASWGWVGPLRHAARTA